jgi:hypothetical protein
MIQHIEVILILIAGIAVLFIVFGTDILIDRAAIRSLPPADASKAIPLWVGLVGAAGLACVAFALDFLVVGDSVRRFQLEKMLILSAIPAVLLVKILSSRIFLRRVPWIQKHPLVSRTSIGFASLLTIAFTFEIISRYLYP